MSNSQVALSPIRVDRKQDITSWIEGDITCLTAQDVKCYTKRKSAIEDYFKTNQSAKEIKQRYHLSTKEGVRTMAKRCLMLHEDGQIWGFRALVPGIVVVDYAAKSEDEDDSEQDRSCKAALSPDLTLPVVQAEAECVAALVEQGETQAAEPLSEPQAEEERLSASDLEPQRVAERSVVDAKQEDTEPTAQQHEAPGSDPMLASKSYHSLVGSLAPLKQFVRRPGNRVPRKQRKQQRLWVKLVSVAVVMGILIGLLLPVCVGLIGYSTYTHIKGIATDGIDNLLALKTLMPASKNDLTSALNAQKLAQADMELSKAQNDFLLLQNTVNRPDVQSLLQDFAPQYSDKLVMAQHLVQVALDVTHMGQELIGVAQLGAGIIHGSPLAASSTKPLITADDISTIEAALTHAQYYIGDIQRQMSQVNLAQIPLGSATQKAQLAKYLQLIPQAQSTIAQIQPLVEPLSWLIGIGQARRYLVQTLDRGELRPSGGFEGQYGTLSLQNGRMGSFSLKDITLLDYAENGAELGTLPPAQYSWMDFGNFGVRDANLSADYPTTAQIVMHYFEQEGGGPIDGDIQITPVVIEQFLKLTGPIYLSQYHDTVTAQNLEEKLHAYQQDPALIALQKQVTGSNTHATRKAFTSLVGTLLLDRAKHLSIDQMLNFGKTLLQDLKTRDLQLYFTNPVLEQWLTQNGDSGAMPQFTKGTDGFMVVQSNISISKASQYVKSTFNDQVQLDSQGGATHKLTITLNYQQLGPVYGYDTYADYLRVYAPSNAQFLGSYGFVSNNALCTPTGGSGTAAGASSQGKGLGVSQGCSQYNTFFPDTSYRNCPQGDYALGVDGMLDTPWPIDSLGGPTETGSDLPGYAMWGGLTLTPKNCITTLTLSWYVPHVVKQKSGASPYTMIVGHQAGWPVGAQISIDASALKGVKSLSYNRTIDVDTTISLHARPAAPARQLPVKK